MSPIHDTISNLLLNCLLLFYQLVIQKNLTTSHGTIVGGCFVEGEKPSGSLLGLIVMSH
jgi:hypothetical protein